MTRFVLYRVAQSLFVVVGVVLLTFVIVRLVPGDPAVAYAGSRATPGQLSAAREKLGLDGSVFTQLQHYLSDLLHGDLGMSIHTRQPVAADLSRYVPASIELVLFAMLIAVPVGLAIGRFAARHHGKAADIVMRIMTILAVSFPAFWLGLILQTTFASSLGWFPIAGEYTSSLDSTSPLHVWSEHHHRRRGDHRQLAHLRQHLPASGPPGTRRRGVPDRRDRAADQGRPH